MPTPRDFVTMIGAGNLAWHLAPALDNAGYAVTEVYSPNPGHAKALVGRLYQAEQRTSLDFSGSRSEIFILAVSDTAITEVAQEIVLPDDAVLVHTSGTQPLGVLGYAATPDIGVCYPLQTFSKGRKISFEEVPVFVEGETDRAEKIILRMARAVSKNVHKLSSADRQVLHLAAVFASNFTNHMLRIAEEVLESKGLDYAWLKPLIAESVSKGIQVKPEDAQTGPARRGDLEILDKHLAYLAFDPQLAEVYRAISQHILDRYTPD